MKRRTFFKAVAGAAAGVAVGKLPAAEPKMIPGPVVEFAPRPLKYMAVTLCTTEGDCRFNLFEDKLVWLTKRPTSPVFKVISEGVYA